MIKNQPNLNHLSQGAKNNSPGPVGIAPHAGQIVCGDIDMCIDSQGLWHYKGSPIGRLELIKLFSSVMRRDSVGEGNDSVGEETTACGERATTALQDSLGERTALGERAATASL